MRKLSLVLAFLMVVQTTTPISIETFFGSFIRTKSFFDGFIREELKAFYDYPIPSFMILTTTTLAGTLVLYEAVNYWKKHKKEEELTSPWAMIAPALIIGYICVKISHYGISKSINEFIPDFYKEKTDQMKNFITTIIKGTDTKLKPYESSIISFLEGNKAYEKLAEQVLEKIKTMKTGLEKFLEVAAMDAGQHAFS